MVTNHSLAPTTYSNKLTFVSFKSRYLLVLVGVGKESP